MFKVVKTVEDGEIFICAVPSTWEMNSILSWPPGLNIEKLRSNPLSKPRSSWRQISCTVKRDCIQTFGEAVSIEDQLSSFTDTESEEM